MKDFNFILKQFIKSKSAQNQILLINIAAFVSVAIFKLISYLLNLKLISEQVINLFYVPGNVKLLAYRPWTLISYQFMHVDFFHIFFNMLMFYYMAAIISSFINSRTLWKIYILGGISGAVLFLLSFNLFPVFRNITDLGFLVGASASVMAVVAAVAVLLPEYEVFLFGLFKIKLKWLAMALILIDISGIPSSNPGGGLAHIGGAVFGFFYMLHYKGSFSFSLKKINKYFEKPIKSNSKKNIKQKEFVSEPNSSKKNYSQTKRYKPNQAEIDAILDKISQSGYDSLTGNEKETLFRASE